MRRNTQVARRAAAAGIVLFGVGLLPLTVAAQQRDVACERTTVAGKEQLLVTVREGGKVYAINGTARTAAAKRGWIDGKTAFDPGPMGEYLKEGLEKCGVSTAASTPAASSPAVAVGSAGGALTADGLRAAANTGDLATIKRYIAAKFDLNRRSGGVPALGTKGSPPVSAAAASKQCEALDLLLNAGAKADTGEQYGFTPLALAAQAGATQCVKSLLAKKVRVDVRTAPGADTPLILAAYQGHLAVVQLLVAAGASKTLKNKDGDNAARAAQVMGNGSVASYLR